MLDYVLLVGALVMLVMVFVFQRQYERKMKQQRRLSDRLWAQALYDMKQSAERKRLR